MSGEFEGDERRLEQEAEKALAAGDSATLDRLRSVRPDLVSPEPQRLLDAVARHPVASIRWLLAQGAPARIEVDDGFPPIHLAIDRDVPDRYDIVRELVEHGADVNERGFNDWTPLHRAAAGRDDVRMVCLLLDLGADPRQTTTIDNQATPEEEARIQGKHRSADAIRDWLSERAS